MKPQTVQIVRQGKARQRCTGLNLIHYKTDIFLASQAWGNLFLWARVRKNVVSLKPIHKKRSSEFFQTTFSMDKQQTDSAILLGLPAFY